MVVATGFFDGVHLGHRIVLEQLVKAAAVRGDESMVITFWPHPRNVLQQEARSLRLLTTLEEKRALIRSLGVDHVEVLPFTKDFSRMTTEAYLRDIVCGQFGARTILLGYDNRMGADSLDSDTVARVAADLGLEVIRTGMLPGEDGMVEVNMAYVLGRLEVMKRYLSTQEYKTIRGQINAGDIEGAQRMLGYPYSIKGVVVEGNRVGRSIGFPTANLQLYEPLKLVPGNGVYLVDVRTLGGSFAGMCNIGIRPTLGEGKSRTIETNIFDFEEDIYGLDMELTFISKIRNEKKFDSLDSLSSQLSSDRKVCIDIMKRMPL